jgi:hypothetical protein
MASSREVEVGSGGTFLAGDPRHRREPIKGRHLATLALLGLLVVPRPTIAAMATLYCNYVTYGGIPYFAMEIPMYSLTEFADFVKVRYIPEQQVYTEKIVPKTSLEDELFGFEIGEDQEQLHLSVFDEVLDKSEDPQRWTSILFSSKDKKLTLTGSCYIN